MQQSEPLNFKWVHEHLSSSSQIRGANNNVTITSLTPDAQLTDAESEAEAEEFLEDLSPSNEPNNILMAGEIQSLDDTEEDGDTETSMLTYKGQDLTLIWEPPVRNTDLDVMTLFSPIS